MGYEIHRRPRPVWAHDPWRAQLRLLDGVPEPVIIDAGANIGQTLQNYLRLFPKARVFCFEPFQSSYERLRAVAAHHPHVVAHQLALAETAGSAVLHTSPDNPTRNSLLTRPKSQVRYAAVDLEEAVVVETATLDDFCQREDLTHIDILKMDVEGAEVRLLRGAKRMLTSGSIDLVFSEVRFVQHHEGGVLFEDVQGELARYGYTLFGVYDSIFAPNGQLRYGNAIFLAPGLRSQVDARLAGGAREPGA